MGAGIAQVSALAGHDVVLQDVSQDGLARGVAGIEKSLARFAEKGKLSSGDVDLAMDRITTTTDLEAAGDAGVRRGGGVREDSRSRRRCSRRLDAICGDGTWCWRPTPRPSRSPRSPRSPIAARDGRGDPLLLAGSDDGAVRTRARLQDQRRDVGNGRATSPRAIGKTVVVVNRDVAGFVTTRLITALSDGGDRAGRVREWPLPRTSTPRAGWVSATPWARWTTADMTGVDIMLQRDVEHLRRQPGREVQSAGVAAADGAPPVTSGRKTGKGFYDYS
jgi:3-hydroxybutyryl-CoA dehydrogenase